MQIMGKKARLTERKYKDGNIENKQKHVEESSREKYRQLW